MALVWQLLMAMASVALATYVMYMKWLRSQYPPGPWPLPIVGNLLLLSKKQHFDFARLAKKYGPVYTIWLGVQPMVIVCNLQHAKEVLLQKGVEFAGRAMDGSGLKRLLRQKNNLFNQSLNEKVPIMRKLILTAMKFKTSEGMSVKKIAEEEIVFLLKSTKEMKEQLEDPYRIINVPVCNTITRFLVNIRFESQNDPRYLEWANVRFERAKKLQRALLVNWFPFLWYCVPSIRKTIASNNKFSNSFLDSACKHHEDTYQEGVLRDFADEMIRFYRSQDEDIPPSQRLTQLNAFGVVREVFEAGTETTIASMCWAFLFLLKRPDIQDKIHNEIDHHVASKEKNRENKGKVKNGADDHVGLMLNLSDRPSLPYLNAFIHEAMRRCPVAPLLLPHKALVDTTLGGYPIPANTGVICNVYACHTDDNVWDNPFEITPERFLNSEGLFNTAKSKDVLQFGAGPRNCVGENLAKMEVFLYIANVLHSFELSCPNPDALPTLQDVRMGIECFPVSYKMSFKIRKTEK